jgi:RNA polymerase sigma-B factor
LRRGETFDDLQQIARVGLLNAVNRFDPDTGSDFLSFAVPTMMGEIRRHFRDHGWAMHVPRRLKALHVRIGAMTPHLTQSLGHAPTAGDLAAALEVPREDIVESLIAANAYSLRSIDAPTGDQAGARPALAEKLGALDTQLDAIHDRESLRPLLAALPERERTVLNLRFFAGMTQTQIAEQMGMSQMHVSRILAKTLLQLREGMLERSTDRDEPAGRP